MNATADTDSPGLDPYLAWARLTDFRYLLKSPEGRFTLRGAMSGLPPDVHMTNQAAQAHPTATLRLPARNERGLSTTSAWIEADSPDEAAEYAEVLSQKVRFCLAHPGMQPVNRAGEPDASLVAPSNQASQEGAVTPIDKTVVIAVIDGRCGLANRAFCLPTGTSGPALETRIDYFWDQGKSATGRWREPAGWGYGRELQRIDINNVFEKWLPRTEVPDWERREAERQVYRDLQFDLPAEADWTHGTHVLATLLSDFDQRVAPVNAQDSKTSRPADPGVIYVQLSDAALRDTSGHWMAAQVLDALQYILDRVRDDAEVIVNLSLGTFAGPHNGTSLLEEEIDRLIEERAYKLSVVVCAGNAGRVKDDGNHDVKPIHAHQTIPSDADKSGKRRSVRFSWIVDVADDTETFVEIWVPTSATHDAPRRVSVSLEQTDPLMGSKAPKVVMVSAVEPGQIGCARIGGVVTAAVFNGTDRAGLPSGSKGSLILVALGHTRDARGGSVCPLGRWTAIIETEDPDEVEVDAWIERRDVPGELPGFRPQYGFDGDADALSKRTLCSLANGKNTLVVGATESIDSVGGYQVSDYSSRGASSTAAAFVYADGRRNEVGFFSGTQKDLQGTSMAAAQVSAAVAAAASLGHTTTSMNARARALEIVTRWGRTPSSSKSLLTNEGAQPTSVVRRLEPTNPRPAAPPQASRDTSLITRIEIE